MVDPCPICAAENVRFRLSAYDDRYAFPGIFDICRCRICRHSYVVPSPAHEDDGRLYTAFYPRAAFDAADFRPKEFACGLASWLNGEACAAGKWVPPGVKVLDIGCGFGEILAYHQARGCDAYGVEVDENVREVVDRFRLRVRIGPFDPDCYARDFFDYVTLQQVIEHLVRPIDTLRGVASVLRSGGYVVISTPNANGWGARVFDRRWINWHVPYHRHFFSRASMELAARASGLVVASSRTITSSEWLRYQWHHLLTCPAEGEASAYWSPRGKRSRVVRMAQKLPEGLHRAKVNHLLTRVFDALGIGDNYLFLLKKP